MAGGDWLRQGGTNYGTLDGPAGPTKVPRVVRGGPLAAATTGPGGPIMGDRL